MKGNLKSWIIAFVVILILLLPILIDFVKSGTVEVISYEDYTSSINDGNFHLIYFGDTNSDGYEKIESNLSEIGETYGKDSNVNVVDYNSLTDSEISSLGEMNSKFNNKSAYAIIKDGEVLYVTDKALTGDELDILVNKYLNNVIPESEIAYKTYKDYKDFKKVIDSKDIVMTVFGRSNCSWCVKFQPIYNDVAAENNVNIYFVDSNSFDSKEYEKIMNSGLKIPASCTDSGKDQALSDGFGTPLSLITKNGKVIDCIGGYTNKTGLLNKLKNVGMIK